MQLDANRVGRTVTKGKIMKRIVLAVATVLLAAGVATGASAAAAAPLPNGVHVKGLTYQPGVHLAAPHLPRFTPANIGTLKSTNWSGYVDVACKTCAVRYVGASFNLPSVNCSALPDGSTVSFWAGLDGFSDTATEQIGAAAQCKSGAASYFLWYEMFPLIAVVFTGVNPGDAISMSVYYNAGTGKWQLVLNDLANGKNLTSVQSCPSGSKCLNSSAEVITEAASTSSGAAVPLPNFAQVGYEGIAVTSRSGLHGSMTPTGLWNTDAIDLVGNAGNSLAVVGPAYGGQAFLGTWKAAQ